jgi:hypothetical protein
MKWRVPDVVNCFKFLLVMMFFAFYINSIVYDGVSNINSMYVAGPPQDGLPFLNENHGWLVYIVHYALLVIVCVTLSYVSPIIHAVKALTRKKSTDLACESHEPLMEEAAISQDNE